MDKQKNPDQMYLRFRVEAGPEAPSFVVHVAVDTFAQADAVRRARLDRPSRPFRLTDFVVVNHTKRKVLKTYEQKRGQRPRQVLRKDRGRSR